jgi:hypothetical protein
VESTWAFDASVDRRTGNFPFAHSGTTDASLSTPTAAIELEYELVASMVRVA